MRIIAGERRGKKLAVLEGTQTRPTSDRARESLFQLIENDMQKRGKVWGDLTFADVFAGTGAVGCEAASRGAKRVFFFENNQVALKCLKENISLFRNVTLFYDALKPMKAYPPIDILFMDAPYGVGLWEKALPLFEQTGWIGPKTLVVIETDKGEQAGVPVGFQENDRRSYGRNTFMLLRMADK
ncbi:MAG: 16S rRNA (guanine(966)-N(2))-methyltransferase RsmD [Alphaproteobacteria bacterium]